MTHKLRNKIVRRKNIKNVKLHIHTPIIVTVTHVNHSVALWWTVNHLHQFSGCHATWRHPQTAICFLSTLYPILTHI